MKTLMSLPIRPGPMWLVLSLLCLLAAWPLGTRAQDNAEVDPPGRVGRLAEVQGEVWIYDDDASEWIDAVRNRPITTGDRLSSAANGRAEVRIGSTTLRLDRNTEVEVTRLDDDRMALHLHSGDLAVRLRNRESAESFELVTPEGRFEPERAGSYRFTRDDDTTDTVVHSGQLQLRAPDAGVTVKAGQHYRFWQQGGTQFELTELRRDDFDDWVASRDDREDRSVSARYVSPEMTGVEDLDRHGRWEQDPEYGALWIPRDVAVGWAPYRAGHWVWISPWGWTWVDDAPWGFAPFHYGRWVMRASTWCWVPGAYVARPVYAPALVGWVGAPGVSVSIGVGRRPPAVGWFPLAPREVYVPGYRYSPHYMRHVNGNHVRPGFDWNPYLRDPHRAIERGRYRYREQPGFVTMVPRQVMERRQPVGPAIVGVSGRPVPGMAPGHPRPDGRPPMMSPRPVQAAVPPAPGAGGDRYGAPRFGRDEPRGRDDGRGRRDGGSPPLPTVVVPAPPQGQPQRPGFPSDDRWGRGHPRDERWQPQRPPQQGLPQPVQPQPQQPQWQARPQPPQGQQPMPPAQAPQPPVQQPAPHRPSWQLRPQAPAAQAPQQQPLPQNPQWQSRPQPPQQQPRPPQAQQPAMPQAQPQPGFGGGGRPGGQAFPGGGQGGGQGNDGARHRRMD